MSRRLKRPEDFIWQEYIRNVTENREFMADMLFRHLMELSNRKRRHKPWWMKLI